MKRRLAHLVAALSLTISLAATAAWALSYARPPGWRLIGTAHSADLTRVDRGRRAALFTTAASWSPAPQTAHHGFWDAWWARSESGRLTLLAQVIDYEGTLRRVAATPPTLVVEPPGEGRPPAVVFGRVPAAGPRARWLGFAWRSDAASVAGAGGPATARAWMVTVPYWLLVLLGAPLPLLWWRAARRRHGAPVRQA